MRQSRNRLLLLIEGKPARGEAKPVGSQWGETMFRNGERETDGQWHGIRCQAICSGYVVFDFFGGPLGGPSAGSSTGPKCEPHSLAIALPSLTVSSCSSAVSG